ncbi:LysR substrate-binding domain-containing protein, partial [Arthrospira platensis SPKY1]|nr:LysR substrate-binding domain-containing protein [Arthrospira platensis SPKY1]
LGHMNYVAVASSAFAQRELGGALSPYNFHRVPFLAFNRKDDLQREFVARAFGLHLPTLKQVYVPSSEGQVRGARLGWGVTVVPQLLVASAIESGELTDVAPGQVFPVPLYWHCWNLTSDVLDQLTTTLREAAALALTPLP